MTAEEITAKLDWIRKQRGISSNGLGRMVSTRKHGSPLQGAIDRGGSVVFSNLLLITKELNVKVYAVKGDDRTEINSKADLLEFVKEQGGNLAEVCSLKPSILTKFGLSNVSAPTCEKFFTDDTKMYVNSIVEVLKAFEIKLEIPYNEKKYKK
jgi:hypothetical protein